MDPETVEVPCPHCRTTSQSPDSRARVWSCPNCGRTYVLRRCDGCGAVSHVAVSQRGGEPWNCVWCHAVNAGFSGRNDPAAAAVGDLAADVVSRGLAFDPAEHVADADVHDTQPVLIVTTNEVPGYRIVEVHGDVFGLVVRARNYFSNLGAQLRTIAGGEVVGYTKLLTESRNQARLRMWREARARGANAVVAMRFDCNEIGDIMSEVAAYGTAVTVEPSEGNAGFPQSPQPS
jgi:uncharacterized protein YbjQ (UPF0145 family)